MFLREIFMLAFVEVSPSKVSCYTVCSVCVVTCSIMNGIIMASEVEVTVTVSQFNIQDSNHEVNANYNNQA